MTPPLVNHEVRADDIRWTLQPIPRVESVNVLELDDEELFTYARDLQLELESVRALLHKTLEALARANLDRDRYQIRVSDLLGELRSARHGVHTLRAQVRVMQDDAA